MYQDNAPETPHILWATPYEQGGISGGLYDGENNIIADMYAGDAYEGRFANFSGNQRSTILQRPRKRLIRANQHTWNPSN